MLSARKISGLLVLYGIGHDFLEPASGIAPLVTKIPVQPFLFF
jgi:hypothetical protein